MVEEDTSANIEWGQKKGVGEKPRASRRIDLQKAMAAEAKDRNSFKAKPQPTKNLPSNLKKLRTKIKDVFDDDDEEDEENEVIFYFNLEDENSSLINALKDDEKNKLQTQRTLDNQKMQQTAGKMEAIIMADKMSKQLGLKGLKKKVALDNIQDVSLNTQTFDKAIKQNVAAKTKIKTENLSSKQTADMVKGLRKMRQAAAASEEIQVNMLENMKAEELVKVGKNQDDKKTAEIILEKSGRKESKDQSRKDKEKKQQKIKTAIRQTKTRE